MKPLRYTSRSIKSALLNDKEKILNSKARDGLRKALSDWETQSGASEDNLDVLAAFWQTKEILKGVAPTLPSDTDTSAGAADGGATCTDSRPQSSNADGRFGGDVSRGSAGSRRLGELQSIIAAAESSYRTALYNYALTGRCCDNCASSESNAGYASDMGKAERDVVRVLSSLVDVVQSKPLLDEINELRRKAVNARSVRWII